MTICDVNKIDSNITNLAFAEEVCLKVLPTLIADGHYPVWFNLEPNSYSDFGGDLTTVARQPISATRQRKKGTVTGLTASGGFNQDVTASNFVRIMQGFFFADARQKAATQPFNGTQVALTSAATSDDSFNAASGLAQFHTGHLLKASGFVQNNGLHRVTTGSVAAKTIVATNLVNETPAATAKLDAVGFQFGSGIVSLTASAAAALLTVSGLAAASGTFTISSANNAVDGDTVTIGTHVYTFSDAPVSPAVLASDEVLVGADKAASCANLAAAINNSTGEGSLYGTGTVKNTQVTAVGGAGTVVVTSKLAGTSSNAIATTEVSTNGSWGAATLAGGTGAMGWLELGLTAGEWIFVGGDTVAECFTQTSSTNLPGYARVLTVTDSVLTLDDTTWTPQTDAGTAKTISVFIGTYIRNEPLPDDIVTRSYNIERQLGKDSNGTQAQYLEGAIANEFKLNMPDKDKLNADLTFVAMSDSTRTGLEGLKIGTRVPAPGEPAYNTSLDLYRVRMAIHDDTEMNTSALFAFVTQADLSITNNAAQVTALGNLGGIDVSVGNFDASGTLTALFSSVEAIRAIRNNADVSFNVIAARANGGFVFDMPLLGLGGGRLAVELNNPITIPLTSDGAENESGYTLSSTWFPYLPSVAMPE